MKQREDNPNYKVKPTNTELRRRLTLVESLVIDCASVPDILRYFAEKENLKLARRTIEGYVHIVEQRIEKAAEPKRELEIRKAKRRFERCFARAISGSKKNISGAIAAQKSLNNMLGLDAPKYNPDDPTLEQLALQIAVQRKAMELQIKDRAGISDEIIHLLERYRSIGEDPAELLRQIASSVKSDDPTTTNSSGELNERPEE